MPIVPASVIRVNEGLADAYGQFGQGLGDLGLALLRYYNQLPTPSQPGTLRFPGGATTPTSPQELAAIRRAGGVPTTTGQQLPLARLPATIPGLPVEAGTVGYQPPNRFNLPPSVQDVARLSQVADVAALQKTQAETRALTPEFQAEQQRRLLGLPPLGIDESGFSPNVIQQIEDDALDGDEDAVAAYRYLKKLGLR